MVKDHSDSERGNPLPPHRLLFPISSKGPFICYTVSHRSFFILLQCAGDSLLVQLVK